MKGQNRCQKYYHKNHTTGVVRVLFVIESGTANDLRADGF